MLLARPSPDGAEAESPVLNAVMAPDALIRCPPPGNPDRKRYRWRMDAEATSHRYSARRVAPIRQTDTPSATDSVRAHALRAGIGRMFELGMSVALLLVFMPLIMIVAVMIRIDSPGPIFYRQVRCGLHGRPFLINKFRSMTLDAEADGTPLWAQQRDRRVTRVGRFIRAARIDELPQLVNVLFGEMSIVGPRPERPHFVEQLTRVLPFYRERLSVKPGITGWAQVSRPYGASVEDAADKLLYDLYYVKNWTILLELRILVATVRVVLFREGAR